MPRGTKKGRPVKGGVRWSGDKEGIDQEHDCGGPKRCGRDPNDLNDGFPILIKVARLHHSLHTSGLGSRLHRPCPLGTLRCFDNQAVGLNEGVASAVPSPRCRSRRHGQAGAARAHGG